MWRIAKSSLSQKYQFLIFCAQICILYNDVRLSSTRCYITNVWNYFQQLISYVRVFPRYLLVLFFFDNQKSGVSETRTKFKNVIFSKSTETILIKFCYNVKIQTKSIIHRLSKDSDSWINSKPTKTKKINHALL